MKSQTAAFTGHRHIPHNKRKSLEKELTELLERLIGEGIIYFGCGGAIGWDLMAGAAVLKLSERHKHIKLIMVLPFREQDAKWTSKQRREYKKLLDAADKITYVSEQYYDGCYLARNRRLVEFSSVCIAYLTNTGRSGTAQTVRLAREQGLTVYNLAEDGVG